MLLHNESRSMMAPFHGHDHDHAGCVEAALGDAERLCARRRGARLTKLRRRVLGMRLALSRAGWGLRYFGCTRAPSRRRAAPPTVYRALAFLMEQGLVHRLESRNAYIGCAMPAAPHSGQFLICGGVRRRRRGRGFGDRPGGGPAYRGVGVLAPPSDHRAHRAMPTMPGPGARDLARQPAMDVSAGAAAAGGGHGAHRAPRRSRGGRRGGSGRGRG